MCTTNFQVSTLTSLENRGLSVAFVKGNRIVNDANIKAKKKSFKTTTGNLVPLMYVSGRKAVVEDRCQLIDPISHKDLEVTNETADNYIVIVDGQHRYKAFIEDAISHDDIILMEVYYKDGIKTQELLSIMNIESSSWSAGDYVNGMDLFRQNKLTEFCRDLCNRGYSISTIGLILSFGVSKLNKKTIAKYMIGEIEDLPFDYNLERAESFMAAVKASHFDDSFACKRYLIEVCAKLGQQFTADAVIEAMPKLQQETVDKLNTMRKVDEGVVKFTLEKSFLQVLNPAA